MFHFQPRILEYSQIFLLPTLLSEHLNMPYHPRPILLPGQPRDFEWSGALRTLLHARRFFSAPPQIGKYVGRAPEVQVWHNLSGPLQYPPLSRGLLAPYNSDLLHITQSPSSICKTPFFSVPSPAASSETFVMVYSILRRIYWKCHFSCSSVGWSVIIT